MPLILPAAALAVALAQTARPTQPPQPPPQTEEPAAKKPTKEKKEKKEKKPKEKPPKPVFRLDDHPTLHFGKGTKIDFRAHYRTDVTDSEAPTGVADDVSAIDLAKKRVGVTGEIKNAVEFHVQYAIGAIDPWHDVYVEYKQFDVARVRAGRFKLPFSLDENTGMTGLDFAFRSLAATHLAPGRDDGVMARGRVLKSIVGYEAGVFQHDGKNARTNNVAKVYGGQTTAARVTVDPLRNKTDFNGDMSIGVAFTTSNVPEGIGAVRGQTVLGQNFFSASHLFVNGQRRRIGVEAQVRPGPFSAKAEYMRLETQRRGESVEDTDLSPLVGEGWYVSGTWAVTGDRKAEGLVRPKRPLLQGGVGAIEVAGRVEELKFHSGSSGDAPSSAPRADVVLPNRDRAQTVGVNWYVNRFVKIQFNLIRETLDDPSHGPLPSKAKFLSKVIRFQFSL